MAVTPSERKGDELVTLPPDWRRSVRSGKTKDCIEFRGPGGKGVATTVAQAWREFNGDVALMPQPRTQPTLTPPVYLTGPQKARPQNALPNPTVESSPAAASADTGTAATDSTPSGSQQQNDDGTTKVTTKRGKITTPPEVGQRVEIYWTDLEDQADAWFPATITGKRWADDTPTSAVEHRLRYDPGRWKAESRWHCLATEDWRLLTSKPSAVAVQAAALTRAITKFGRSQRAEERKQCSTDLRVDARLMAALESVSGLLIVQ